MEAKKLSSIRFRNITRSSAVQERVKLVQPSPRLKEMPIEREEVKLPPELACLDTNPYYGRIAFMYKVRERN